MPLQKVFLLYRWVGSSKKQLFYADILYILHLDSRLKLLCTYVIYWENRNTLLLRFRNLGMIVWVLFIWKIFYVVCKNMTRNGHKWLTKVVKWPFMSRNFWAPLDKLCKYEMSIFQNMYMIFHKVCCKQWIWYGPR